MPSCQVYSIALRSMLRSSGVCSGSLCLATAMPIDGRWLSFSLPCLSPCTVRKRRVPGLATCQRCGGSCTAQRTRPLLCVECSAAADGWQRVLGETCCAVQCSAPVQAPDRVAKGPRPASCCSRRRGLHRQSLARCGHAVCSGSGILYSLHRSLHAPVNLCPSRFLGNPQRHRHHQLHCTTLMVMDSQRSRINRKC